MSRDKTKASRKSDGVKALRFSAKDFGDMLDTIADRVIRRKENKR